MRYSDFRTSDAFTESVLEQAALAWLEAWGWRIAHGPDIAPDMPAAAPRDHAEVVLSQRLRGVRQPEFVWQVRRQELANSRWAT